MKTNEHFKLSKSSKKLIATISSKEEKFLYKKMMIEAESKNLERMVMNYDVSANGSRPKKKERIDPSQNTPLKVV